MKSERIFKQVSSFEKKVQQLEKCDDSLSDSDWNALEEKLPPPPETQKLAKLASVFVKIASDNNDDDLLLPINDTQKSNAVSQKSSWIVDMDPSLFLDLTTPDGFSKFDVINKAKPLEFYMSSEVNNNIAVHPFLYIEKESGKIRGHEGRHRAASVLLRRGKYFRVALQLKPETRSYRPKDMPMVWVGEFNGKNYNVKDLISQGKIKIVDDSVQQEFWRADEDY
jgi:hypothetical protein